MKKIYLEKQFMKATNSQNYILGDIVASKEEKGLYQIYKKDGSILNIFSHAILGWEDDDRKNRAFTNENLLKIYKTRFSNNVVAKTIYLISTNRKAQGNSNGAILRIECFDDDSIAISSIRTFFGTYQDFADSLANLIKLHKDCDLNSEIVVDTIGLGSGLLGYLEQAPYPIRKFTHRDIQKSTANLIEKVNNKQIALREKPVVYEALENLNIESSIDEVHFSMEERNDVYHAIVTCLMMACI